jgi:hypothetical protein
MDVGRSIRIAGLICAIGAALAVGYALTVAVAGWEPTQGFAIQALIHLVELIGVIGLALSGAAGVGWLGRVGLRAALLGFVILIVAELVFPSHVDAATQLFNLGPPLVGVGLVLAGIAVLQARRWTGWQRWIPLIWGLYVFVVMTPVFLIAGPPPATIGILAIAGWDVCAVLLGVALVGTTVTARSGQPSAVA